MEIDEALEDEYAAQHMEAQHMHSSEVNSENENKAEIEISALLIDISETLRLLNEQMIHLNFTADSNCFKNNNRGHTVYF